MIPAPIEESAPPTGYVVDCTKRNFQDSANFCKSNGWTMATFQSDTDVDVAKDKLNAMFMLEQLPTEKGIGNGSTVHLGGRMEITMV